MADISLSTSLIVSKGNLAASIYANSVTATMNQSGLKTTVYTLSTNATSLSTANLSSVGMAQFWNLATDTNATTLISVVNTTGTIPVAAPRPGEPAILRLAPGVSFQAIGHTAAVLRVDITEG